MSTSSQFHQPGREFRVESTNWSLLCSFGNEFDSLMDSNGEMSAGSGMKYVSCGHVVPGGGNFISFCCLMSRPIFKTDK